MGDDLARMLDEIVAEAPEINVNTADVSTLLTLPFMTPDLADEILRERQRAPFANWDDFSARVPLDPLQTYVYARVLRFPVRQARVTVHGAFWGRGAPGTSRFRPGFRWRVQGRRAGGVLRGPDLRGYAWVQTGPLRWWLGTLVPRWGFGLLPGSRPSRWLYRARGWSSTGTPALALEVRGRHRAMVLYASSKTVAIRLEISRRIALNLAAPGLSVDGALPIAGGVGSWEVAWIQNRLCGAAGWRLQTPGYRWRLRWSSTGGAALEGGIRWEQGHRITVLSRWNRELQVLRIWHTWEHRGLRVRWGFRQRASSTLRRRWFLEIWNQSADTRVYGEGMGSGQGWLLTLDRRWRRQGTVLGVKWSVFQVSPGASRLWLSDPAPGFRPRVRALSAPGGRGTVYATWSIGPVRVTGRLSGEIRLPDRRMEPEIFLGLRYGSGAP